MALGGIDHPLGTRMPLGMRMPYAQRMVHGGTVPDKSIHDAYVPLPLYTLYLYTTQHSPLLITQSFSISPKKGPY